MVTVRINGFDIEAYVDSGAFYSIFSAFEAEAIGIDFKKGKLNNIIVGDGNTIPVYFHTLPVMIGNISFNFRRFQDRLKKELKNPEFKKAFDQEEIFASLAIQIAQLRQKQGLSQKDLAKRLKTTQQTVSRIEDIGNKSLSLSTLLKLAGVLHKQLKIELV